MFRLFLGARRIAAVTGTLDATEAPDVVAISGQLGCEGILEATEAQDTCEIDGTVAAPVAAAAKYPKPAGAPGKGRRKVVYDDKVYDVAEADIPAFLQALTTSGEAEKVVRTVKRGRKRQTVEEWKPVIRFPVLAPFQFYEPVRIEMAARADEYMLAALEQLRREEEARLWVEQDEEDAEILAMAA